MNKQKKKVASLEEYAADLVEDTKNEFENVVGQDSLTRFDTPKRSRKRNNKRKSNNNSKGSNTKNNNNKGNNNNKRGRKPQNKKSNAK